MPSATHRHASTTGAAPDVLAAIALLAGGLAVSGALATVWSGRESYAALGRGVAALASALAVAAAVAFGRVRRRGAPLLAVGALLLAVAAALPARAGVALLAAALAAFLGTAVASLAVARNAREPDGDVRDPVARAWLEARR